MIEVMSSLFFVLVDEVEISYLDGAPVGRQSVHLAWQSDLSVALHERLRALNVGGLMHGRAVYHGEVIERFSYSAQVFEKREERTGKQRFSCRQCRVRIPGHRAEDQQSDEYVCKAPLNLVQNVGLFISRQRHK